MQIFMRIEHIGRQLHSVNRDIRAMVGHALVISEQIGEDKAQLNGAFAVLQAVDMACLKLLVKLVYNLLKRLNVGSLFDIVINKRIYRYIEYFGHGGGDYIDFIHCVA